MPQAVPFLIAAAKAIFVKVIIALAVNAALYLVQRALTGGAPKPEQSKTPVKQPIPPVQVGFGEDRISGPYSLFATVGKNTLDVVMLARGPIESFEGFFLNDDYLPLDAGGGPLTVSPTTGAVSGGTDGRYGSSGFIPLPKVRILHRLGTFPETAYAEVISAAPGIWTTDHRMDGIASVALICGAVKQEDLQKVYPNFEPLISARCKLSKVYDPRLDDTQEGGAGPQRRNDPTTWTWSANAPLCHLHDEWFNRGQDWDYRFQPALASWMAAADIADEQIDRANPSAGESATVARYAVACWYQLHNPPKEIRDRFLQTYDGMMIERGDGAFQVYAGRYYDPTVVLNEDRILECAWRRSRRREDAVNKLVISYKSPDHGFTMIETTSWLDQASIDLVGEQPAPYELEWVTENIQARMLAKRQMSRLKALYQGSVTVSLSEDETELEQRYFRLRNKNGPPSMWDVVVEVTGVTLSLEERRVKFDIIQADPLIDEWDPAEEEGEAPAPPTPPVVDPIPVPEITDVEVFWEDIGGGATAPRLAVTIDDLDREDLTYRISWRVTGDASWNDEAAKTGDTAGGDTVVDSGFVPGVPSLDVRIRAVSSAGEGEWSATEVVDTSAPLVTDAPTDLAVTSGQFSMAVTFRYPTGPNWAYVRLLRAKASNNIADAASVAGDLVAALGAVYTATETVAAGHYRFWVQAYDSLGNPSALVGPVHGYVYEQAGTQVFLTDQFNTAGLLNGGNSGAGSAVPVTVANTIVAPDGLTTGDEVTFVRGAGFSRLIGGVTVLASTSYKWGMFLKAPAAGPSIALRAQGVVTATLNLTTEWEYYEQIQGSGGTTTYNQEMILWNTVSGAPASAVVHAWRAKIVGP